MESRRIPALDEAYLHFGDSFSTCSDLAAKDKDLIILRTFSKIYLMAGIRAGAAFGRQELLERIKPLGAGATPVTGMVAATASLKVPKLVPERKRSTKTTVKTFLPGCKRTAIRSFRPRRTASWWT